MVVSKTFSKSALKCHESATTIKIAQLELKESFINKENYFKNKITEIEICDMVGKNMDQKW